MQIVISNQTNIPLLKTHRQKVEKAAETLAQRMGSAFRQEVALNKSTTAVYDMIVSRQTISVKVTAINKQ